MSRDESNVREMYELDIHKIETEIDTAVHNAVDGEWVNAEGNPDHKGIVDKLQELMLQDASGKILAADNMALIRDPHLYPKFLELVHSTMIKYGSGESVDSSREYLKNTVAEEQLHGVPVLGHEDVNDIVYGVAFFRDQKTNGYLTVPFTFVNTENKEIVLDVYTTPAIILGDKFISEGDRIGITRINEQ